MDRMNQNNNNPYGQKNDADQQNNTQQINSPYQANDMYQQNNEQQMNNPYQPNNPYYHNPYQPQNNSGGQGYPYNQPGRKKGIGTKLAIGIACAFVALIGIGVGALAYYRSTPSYKISKGFQNLAKEVVQTSNPLMDKIGMNDILLMMQEDGSHVESKLNFAVGLPFIGETTMGVDMDFYRDMHAKEMSTNTSLSVMNYDFAHLNIYANDEVFCFSMPELFIENLYIENENVVSQYKRSIWADWYPINAEDFSIELFPDENERISMRDLRNLSRALGDFQDDIDACRDGMTIEKVEKGLYRVTFPAKEFDRLVKSMWESYGELYGVQKELVEWKESYKRLVLSDVKLLLEIDGSNRIESIMLENPVEMLDGEASLEGEVFFMGDTRSIDKIQGKISVNGADDITRQIIGQMQLTSTDDAYKMDIDLKLTEEEETIGMMKFVVDCDAVRDEFGITYSLKDDVDDISMVLEGSVDDIVKGESVELDLDKAAVNIDGEELVKFTGEFTIEPLKKTIKPSAEPETAFFEMTFSDWEVIIGKLDDAYGGLLNSLLW